VTETDAGDLLPTVAAPPRTARSRRARRAWKSAIGLAGLAGLAVAAVATARDAVVDTLPAPGHLAAALALHAVALMCAARAWVALFPPTADRRALAAGLYSSQLTKYLPAGGVVQAASQVALASEQGGASAAALRLPVFSLCSVVAGVSIGSLLVFDGDLPAWGRALAACGILSVGLLHRSVAGAALRLGRRFVRHVPEATALPSQRAILSCFGFALGNLVAFGVAFAVLLGGVTDVDPVSTVAALCAGWAAGYLVLFVPSGLGVREAVLLAALPQVATATLLSASVAHRLVGLGAEAGTAGASQIRVALARRRARPGDVPAG
jgi:glycosyltransferase 2 family protein